VLRRGLASAVAAVCAAALVPGAASGAVHGPPRGKIFTGVGGGLHRSDYTRFAAASGHHPAVWQIFLTWDQDRGENPYQFVRARLGDAAGLRARLMLHLSTARQDGREFISPAGIASGAGDRYLLGLNRELAASGQIVYVRPFAEMNNANNVYSPYGHGSSHSTANFRRAFRRVVLILRGGATADVNRALRARGMAPVQTSAREIPSTGISIVWCPQVAPAPWSFWPGAGYVDWIATDFYSGFPNWSGLRRFYGEAAGRRKPFALAEFGVWQSGDAPGFTSSLMSWARSHGRVRMTLYFQGNEPGGQFALGRWPGARSALRAAWSNSRFVEYPG
jgi:hypothetical protein